MKKIYTILATLLLVVASSFATTVTYNYNFESGNTDWYFVQTKKTNAWVRSTAAGSASTGNYALHISPGDNTYGYTNNYLSTSWVYSKSVTLTAGSTISFSWKGYGEVGYDYMMVYLFPYGSYPTAGSESVPSGAIQLGEEFSGKTDWQTVSYTPAVEGDYKLCFMWRNDASDGNDKPAAIDDVTITTPPAPFIPASKQHTFETDAANAEWRFIQLGQNNRWRIGTSAGDASTGSKALYISKDGTNYGYEREEAPSVSWAYLPLILTEEDVVSFNWKGVGEKEMDYYYDYLGVYLIPEGSLPKEGDDHVSASSILLGRYCGKESWQTVTSAPVGVSGNYYLCFMWANDEASGSDIPAAIDNVVISGTVYYMLTTSDDGNGSVTRTPDLSSYEKGSVVTLTAVANTGYKFKAWSDGSTDNPRTLIMDANKSLTATFQSTAVAQYTLTVAAGTGGSVKKTPNRDSYAEGTVVTIEAVPDEGYAFSQWSDGNKDNPRKITMDQDYTLQASFNVLLPTDITELTIKAKELAMTITWKSTAPHFEVLIKDKDDKQVEKVIKDNAGEDKLNEHKYTVEKNGKYTVSVTALDATYQPIGASASKEVALKKTVYHSLTILATENGRASMAVGTQEYQAGEEVSLMPIADEGYVFEKWMVNGSVKNTENLVLTMDEDYEVKPVFKPQDVAVDNIPVGESSVQKYLRDGQLFIIRDGKIYNVIGREM